MKKVFSTLISSLLFLTAVSPVFAHVVVRPDSVGVSAFQTFTVGVPVEKDVPTTSLRVVLPEGLQYVTPNVKQGWTIDVKKEGEGENAKVTEITWTGGSIPAGQRDEFLFSAQVPSKETNLIWKAYQTYEDGTVVSWDHDPKAEHEHAEEESNTGPYSQTAVVNDLQKNASENKESNNDALPITLSIAALALSIVALVNTRRKK